SLQGQKRRNEPQLVELQDIPEITTDVDVEHPSAMSESPCHIESKHVEDREESDSDRRVAPTHQGRAAGRCRRRAAHGSTDEGVADVRREMRLAGNAPKASERNGDERNWGLEFQSRRRPGRSDDGVQIIPGSRDGSTEVGELLRGGGVISEDSRQ